MDTLPRITFGMIVLNGEPYLRYNLRSLYPFAHQIIVVEGAVPAARANATPDGHSVDGTLRILQEFKTREDPENKLQLITAELDGHPDGFWPGEKDEQSEAYARRATGDYLWQVDVDEFYQGRDMEIVLNLLRADPEITTMSFRQIRFWGGFDYLVDGWSCRRFTDVRRVFRWGPGYRYLSHRPPVVHDAEGRDLCQFKWIKSDELWSKYGILLYHYALVFPGQVLNKARYYDAANWTALRRERAWAEETYLRLRHPYRVFNNYTLPSWLERFTGEHPQQIQGLRADLALGRLAVPVRQTDDVERLLRSPFYRLGRSLLQFLEPYDRRLRLQLGPWRRRLSRARAARTSGSGQAR